MIFFFRSKDVTGHKMCSEETKPSPIHTKKHHYIPDSPDKGVFSTSPENSHSKLCIYTSKETAVCQGQKSVFFSHDELQWSTAVIASSAKREAACDVLLN